MIPLRKLGEDAEKVSIGDMQSRLTTKKEL